MEIKVIDPTANKLHTSIGISEERSDELSNGMTKIMQDLLNRNPLPPYCIMLQEISKMCNTPEELAYCITNNYNYLVVKGIIRVI